MQTYVQELGPTDVVVDGEEAIQAFRIAWEENDPYDVIFLDIMMPNIDGQEALKEIREIERSIGIHEKDQVKVIMTTALGDPRNVVEAYHKGAATSYLVKPIERQRLMEELDNLGLI